MTTKTDYAALARAHRKQERFGEDGACQLCGETDVRGLRQVTLTHPPTGPLTVTLCAGCHVQLQGKGSTERHHPAGQANDACTVALPATEHAVLSDAQYAWPPTTLRNPDGSPLLRAAASLRGWLDILQLLIERTVGRIPAVLEQLDAALCGQIGPCYWKSLGLEGGPR